MELTGNIQGDIWYHWRSQQIEYFETVKTRVRCCYIGQTHLSSNTTQFKWFRYSNINPLQVANPVHWFKYCWSIIIRIYSEQKRIISTNMKRKFSLFYIFPGVFINPQKCDCGSCFECSVKWFFNKAFTYARVT